MRSKDGTELRLTGFSQGAGSSEWAVCLLTPSFLHIAAPSVSCDMRSCVRSRLLVAMGQLEETEEPLMNMCRNIS